MSILTLPTRMFFVWAPRRSPAFAPRATLARWSLAFAIVSLVSARHALAASPEWGQPVVGIRLDCDAHLNFEDFTGQITQRIGEPLDRSKVAESLKKLYATGRFLELRADIEQKDPGVDLLFVGRAVFFVGVVQVEGTPKTLDPRVLINASRLRLGQALFEEDLAEASKRLTGVLADNGYYQGRIDPRLTPDLETQETEVLFSILPGAPAQLNRVEFQGHTLVPSERLAAIAGWQPGIHLTSAHIERGLFKIHKFYTARGSLQATVNIQKRVYDPKSRTETLGVQVEAGPQVRIRVLGAHISNSKLSELLPVFKDGVVDDDSVARGGRTLEDYFQRQGYFSSSVKAKPVDHSDPQAIAITYQATLGTRGEFAGYGFQGNRSVTTPELAAALAEEPNASSNPRNVFSHELLAHHVEALRTVYETRGFLDSRVTPHMDNHFDNQSDRLFVTFEIEEGPQTKVGHLVLQGVTLDMQKKIWPSLPTKAGEPYSPQGAQSDRDHILATFADLGYTRASVSWNASPPSPAHKVDLEYHIDLGPQERIGRVVLLGNRHTRGGIIRREIAFRKGEPLRQSEVLESQQQLYDLGVFNQVQISTQDPQSPETEKTVLVNVEEARRWTLGYGGGLEVQRLGSNQPEGQLKASPRLSLEVTRLNVGGRAQTFALRGRLSNLEKGGAVSYLIARLPTRRDLSLRLNALVDRSRDVLTFTAERQEASFSLEKHYSPATILLGRLSFRRVLVDASTLRISHEAIPLLSRPARITMLGTSYVNDHRDNPTDATEGSYSVADAGVSWDKLGSEADFFRFSGQNATYYRLTSHLVFARNTRFQVESPFGGPSIRARGIPLPERFFMGGSESHRGFSINQAGPRDPLTGFPIGGNGLFFNSLELRLPAGEKRLGFVLFHDAGNVYSTIRRMRLLKVTQGSPTQFDYTVHATGLGARYNTPLGPVRFDVAYDLNPPRFQVQVQHSQNLPPTLEVRRLPRFQFFLSIGQSF